MARQVLSPIDLRTSEEKRGLSKSQRNLMAITSILQTLGQAEQTRRERQQLDSIATAMAGGATSIEAINAEVNKAKQTQFSGGISGILQRIGGGFQPSPGGGVSQGIQQAIVGQGVKQALAPKSLATTGLSQPEKDRRERFKEVTKDIDTEIKRLTKVNAQGQFPVGFDNAKELSKVIRKLRKTKRELRVRLKKGGETEARIFDRKGNVIGFRTLGGESIITKRTGTTQATTKEITETDVRLQSAPDMRLDQFWPDLSTEEKKEIIQKLDENPDNIDEILRILQSG